MKARILNICLAVLLIAAGYVWGNRSVVHAQYSSAGPAGPLPKAWGHLVGGMENSLIFEDSDGVIRVVSPLDGQVMYKLNRQ